MGQLAEKRYDAVVIGTGFGGAVAACRLAQAGLSVGVLERGKRFPPGTFPTRHDALAWQFGGPYDIKPLQSIAVVQAAGYGGGSLIYANVQMRAAADLFREGWPTPYSRESLDPDYDLVAHMLDIKPIEADPATGTLPVKTTLVEAAAARLGRGEQAFRPNLAVNFSDPSEGSRPNGFGVLQSGCTHCGRCDVGCNVGAKNTLDLNYLAAAENAGAEVATQAELEWLAPEAGGYRLRYRDREAGTRREVSAAEVYLCMGAVNTSEFLLRCRDQFRTLPNLSSRLGCSYSSNGDFFAFGLGPESGFAATHGPTITVAMTYDDGGDIRSPLRFTLEEGGYRKELAALLPLLSPGRMLGLLRKGRRAGNLAARLGAEGDGTIMFLVMGRDRSDGKLELTGLTRRLKVRWDRAANSDLYEAEAAACQELIRELGGTMRLAPNWRLFGQPSTVHNLGGCAMGADPTTGVVDPWGEAFGYPGLRVLDGSIIPRAIGVNPSHTIAAVAERCIRHAIRRRPGFEAWTAPEAAAAPRRDVPEDAARMQPPPPAAAGGRNVALLWRERMRGECSGAANRRAVDLRLTVRAGSASAFVADRNHRADVTGMVTIESLADGVTVEGGCCNLFVDQGTTGELAMIYTLPFRLADGTQGLLEGRKRVRGRWPWDFWQATTNMAVTIAVEGAPKLTGIVGLDFADVGRMGLSLRAYGSGSRRRNLAGMLSFLGFFAVNLLRLARAGWRPSP